MERNTHPVVLVPAVIGGLALVAVMGMFLMMSGMRMPGCWAAGLLDNRDTRCTPRSPRSWSWSWSWSWH